MQVGKISFGVDASFNRVAKGQHHNWISRDYLDIDCLAVGCEFNIEKKCGAPSRCEVGLDGRCLGFLIKKFDIKKLDGD